MCLIIAKPAGQPLPSDSYITNAYNTNPDGFGVATWDKTMGSVVTINKGAMNIAQIFDLIDSIENPIKKHIIFHFRFATEGKVCRENCHPFPISAKIDELKALKLTPKIAIAHNGMILNFAEGNGKNTVAYGWENWVADQQKELSDTQEFIRDFLVGMGRSLFNQKVQALIRDYTESKFAILTANKLSLIGEFKQDKGCYYSNNTYLYKPFKVQTPPTRNFNGIPYAAGTAPIKPIGARVARMYKNETLPIPNKDTWKWCDVCGEGGGSPQYCAEEEMWLCPNCYQHLVRWPQGWREM